MSSFRDHQPKRRPNRAECEKYTSYRKTLRADFQKRCGYCNDFDRMRIFAIDHFLPQKPLGCTHTIAPNYYYNLVYACMHCNLAKSNKWPTNDPTLSNDGLVGFIDPELPAYADLFERNDFGEIIPRDGNELGKYIIQELKLWLPIHAKTWQFERLRYYEEKLNSLPEHQKTQAVKERLASIATGISTLIYDLFPEED